MKAMCLSDSSDRATVEEEQIPQPQPGPGELLVRVHAVGITPTERLWYPTSHTKTGGTRSRAVPGHEFSGVVAAVGSEVTGLAAGDEVYGLNDWFADGALAEYCVTEPGLVVPKPRGLTHVEAASVPIGALTAWQGIYDRAKLQAGERVLVHGGAGAVGVFAVQLARIRGAHVIATVSARNLDFVSQLGADQAIDYRASRFEQAVRDVDVVFDTVGGETLERSWGVLKPGGRLVTIAADSEATADERVKQAFFIVDSNREQLIEIGNLLEAGRLRTVVDAVLPFAQAPAAFTGNVGARLGRGKLVVAVAEPAQQRAVS
ncbi:MAG TPA: NADP-dependent oxidoreductase [Bryobacteraceae bacterium]|nr:NADP-dependent oxidoreductase [Bryobacteraceae bacterium]